MTTSKGFSFPTYSSKPLPARDPDLGLPLVGAGEVQHGTKLWQTVEVWMAVTQEWPCVTETALKWEICNTDSTARQPNRKPRRSSKNKMALQYIITTSILWATKKTAPHMLHLPLPGLISENNLNPLNRNLRSRFWSAEHKALLVEE